MTATPKGNRQEDIVNDKNGNGTNWGAHLNTAFLGILATICVCGIPWSYQIHAKVSSIETRLEGLVVPPPWFEKDVEENSRKISEIVEKLHMLERRLKLP